MLVDAHCHLDHPRFDADREAVIARARAAGVSHLITVGADLDSTRRALDIAAQHEGIWATAGVHPHCAAEAPAGYLDALRGLCAEAGCVAIGEVGLDYHYDYSPRPVQRQRFAEQLALARALRLPVVIHTREAEADTLDLLRAAGPLEAGGVIHCFSGSLDLARRGLELGLFLSIPGIVTYKNPGALPEVVRAAPLDSLLVETDAPYLAPAPHRGERNEPAFVVHTVARVAELSGCSEEDVRRTTAMATARCFRLELDPQQARGRIAYVIRGSLYLNITNACTLACVFCPKQRQRYLVKGHPLKLERQPSAAQIIAACGDDLEQHREVVFVGLGEPTLRLAVLKEVAAWLKQRGKRVRVDTDGLADLVHGRAVAPELVGLVDELSVSLNAADAETYARLCPSRHGAAAYAAVKAFIASARAAGIEVCATVVGLPEFDQATLERCRHVAEVELGVRFRIRAYDNVG